MLWSITMSHFSRVKSQITIKEALVKGLQRLGLPVEVHDKPVQLINTWGDRAIAEVIVRRSYLSIKGAIRECRSDLGFSWNTSDGVYQILFDESYEFRHSILLEKFSNYQNFRMQLEAAYQIESLPILYPDAHFNISEEVQAEDGSYTFEITKKVDPFALQEVGASNWGY